MKNLPLLFCGIFFCLAFSWMGLILSSHLQYGDLQPMTANYAQDDEGRLMKGVPEEGEPLYPQAPVGLAAQGKLEYISHGCMYCHSQQVRRKGYGADFERNWGNRQTVPRDYILQDRVLLGTLRTGPDLMTVGNRLSSADWHHLHLYNPKITSDGKSIMPPYAFLYEVRKIGDKPAPNALKVPATFPEYQPPAGYEIVPTERAESLVAYLLSLKLDYELPESKFSE
jgi:cytochrome c oxidase cbb3-type subunit 2